MLSLLALMALMTAEPAAADAAPPPVRLVAVPTDRGVRLQVIGDSDRPFAGSYALEASGGESGGNRTVQRGTVRLEAGVPATLMTLNLGVAGGSGWNARLRVEPVDGPAYEDVQGAP